MIDRTADPNSTGANEWEVVARHDFDGPAELDVTIVTALGEESCCEGPPLYTAVDTEPAERFLRSVDGDDASVVFVINGWTVRVSADGRIAVRDVP
ncbi:HalOD1 output domain-containing protein [Halobellus captivus]|uniref:HalOD1 output domain-containing protein n=1 Tax=Halobellus captivus TaxID=2592614 RepID=UPI0011AAFDB2|nr:HalOD1 output domain-containing protein [Halobellus captivus]